VGLQSKFQTLKICLLLLVVRILLFAKPRHWFAKQVQSQLEGTLTG
jgi:hypothetical protein